jgi:glycosyltransferase involved in cell wall biosynthesis
VSRDRPLRLLLYSDAEQIGGAEISMGNLVGALAPEIEVGVLCLAAQVGEAVAARREGVRVLTARAPTRLADRRSLAEHMRAIRAFGPDILHLQKAWPWACLHGQLTGIAARGVRVVAVDQLPMPVALPRLSRLARGLVARRLDAHVAVGERAARMIETLIGLPAGSATSVPNGVPQTSGDPAPEFSRPAGPVIGSLGRLTDQKGYDLLVRALPELPVATLVLVGDGPEREPLQALASELGVADRLQVTGWRAHPRGYLSSFDVFALPSRWEGMPLSILEAMHAGLPVVAGDVGSVAECVLDGETGFVMPAGDLRTLTDRLARLLADPAMGRRMGERARVVAGERFTDVAMARGYEAVYERLLRRD